MAVPQAPRDGSTRLDQDVLVDEHGNPVAPATPLVVPISNVPATVVPKPITPATVTTTVVDSNAAVQVADPAPVVPAAPTAVHAADVLIYSHSTLFYWWPLWVGGYLIAGVIALFGQASVINGREQWFFPGSGVGVTYSVLLLLVVLFTNVSARGIASVVLILSVLFVTVLFAWLGWWDNIFRLIPQLDVHMNLGFYLFISTALFLIWALSFFLFDRLKYWRVQPGQMTEERLIGNATQSYDTRGMMFEKYAEDPFRHIILGLGAGDLKILTSGARKSELYISNVLFVDRKVKAIQQLIAVQPDVVT